MQKQISERAIVSLIGAVQFVNVLDFMMIMPLGQAFGAITSVNSALGALGRIQEIIALPSEGEFDRDLAPLAVLDNGARGAVKNSPVAVEFVDVRFSYPGTRRTVHERLNFTAAAGERAGVLIAGPLGICFLPAFICLGVVPVVAGLARNALTSGLL